MEQNAYQLILEKYLYDIPLTPAETQLLIQYLREHREELVLNQIIEKALTEKLFDSKGGTSQADRIYNNILGKANLNQVEKKSSWVGYGFWRVAASILFFLGVALGGYKYFDFTVGKKVIATNSAPIKKVQTDALPGTDKAYLKLANGDSILLTQPGNGTLALQGGTEVLKQGGQLSYNVNATTKSGETVFNTLTIPRGGKFQLVLPDGSKVWMNSVSSLRFPTAFSGRDRRVVLTGEAYFEVVKNKTLPFIVETNGMEVKVLGTNFNVAAYPDEEAIKTTLFEGSVQVRKEDQKVLLSPGKQSTLLKASGAMQVTNANLQEAIAWKNELFVFKNTDMKSVMRQLSRWYDMEVVFKGEVDTRLNGMISRNTNLSDALKILKLSGGAQFNINGNLITVSANPQK